MALNTSLFCVSIKNCIPPHILVLASCSFVSQNTVRGCPFWISNNINTSSSWRIWFPTIGQEQIVMNRLNSWGHNAAVWKAIAPPNDHPTNISFSAIVSSEYFSWLVMKSFIDLEKSFKLSTLIAGCDFPYPGRSILTYLSVGSTAASAATKLSQAAWELELPWIIKRVRL